jgi:hypothetical protein
MISATAIPIETSAKRKATRQAGSVRGSFVKPIRSAGFVSPAISVCFQNSTLPLAVPKKQKKPSLVHDLAVWKRLSVVTGFQVRIWADMVILIRIHGRNPVARV